MSRQKPDLDVTESASSLDRPGTGPTHEEIAIRAYELYEASGRPEGRDGEHWLEAERELTEKYAAQPSRAKSTSA